VYSPVRRLRESPDASVEAPPSVFSSCTGFMVAAIAAIVEPQVAWGDAGAKARAHVPDTFSRAYGRRCPQTGPWLDGRCPAARDSARASRATGFPENTDAGIASRPIARSHGNRKAWQLVRPFLRSTSNGCVGRRASQCAMTSSTTGSTGFVKLAPVLCVGTSSRQVASSRGTCAEAARGEPCRGSRRMYPTRSRTNSSLRSPVKSHATATL
jgi:hypothetical protein